MTCMKISVALACYNGEEYIKEQLDSILAQTVPVDEIVISDDGSRDGTVSIISAYEDPRIRLIFGNPRPGCCGNFEYALNHITGDVIFLCDQDDIWMANKVEKHLALLNENPHIELVVTNGTLIDKSGNILDKEGYDINSLATPHLCGVGTGPLASSDYFALCTSCTLAHGMRMCFKKSLLSLVLPFPDSNLMHHDRWIGFCGLRNDSVFYLNEKLVLYRLHDTNISMSRNRSMWKRLQKALSDAYHTPFDMHNLACSMLEILPENDSRNDSVASDIKNILNASSLMICALSQNPFQGIATLLKLRRNSEYYQLFGPKTLLAHIYLLLFGRRFMKAHPRRVQKSKDNLGVTRYQDNQPK